MQLLTVLVLIAAFSTPLLANAQSCTDANMNVGAACSFGGNNGICTQGDEGVYCRVPPTGTVTAPSPLPAGQATPPQPPTTFSTGGGNTGGSTFSPGGGNIGTTLVNPLGANTTLMSLLQSILNFVIQIGTVIVIMMLVYVGYKFVVAQGEPGKITEARNMLLWTVIGALILLGAKVIATGIEATVNALMVGK